MLERTLRHKFYVFSVNGKIGMVLPDCLCMRLLNNFFYMRLKKELPVASFCVRRGLHCNRDPQVKATPKNSVNPMLSFFLLHSAGF